MAIEHTTGRVRAIKISSIRGFVEIDPEGTGTPPELFIIWFGDEARGPAALYTSELTTAMARRLNVTVAHESTGAYIEDLTIHAPGT